MSSHFARYYLARHRDAADVVKRPALILLIASLGLLALADGVLAEHGSAEGEALIAANPGDPAAYVTAAADARERGELGAALDILEKGRDELEPSAALLVALGELYWDLEWTDDALAAYHAAVAADSSSAIARYRVVTSMVTIGSVTAAESTCRQALERMPDSGLLHVALGECLEKLEQLQEAFGTYGRALELEPTLAAAHSRRGRLLCGMGQYEAAAVACQTALEHDENDPIAHAYMGVACSELGRFWEAQIHAEAAEQAGMSMESVWKRIGKWER
ncbi:MAG: hypothetical protein R6X25_12680 [Candidatus Krumholzibacteriia bacterium]